MNKTLNNAYFAPNSIKIIKVVDLTLTLSFRGIKGQLHNLPLILMHLSYITVHFTIVLFIILIVFSFSQHYSFYLTPFYILLSSYSPSIPSDTVGHPQPPRTVWAGPLGPPSRTISERGKNTPTSIQAGTETIFISYTDFQALATAGSRRAPMCECGNKITPHTKASSLAPATASAQKPILSN